MENKLKKNFQELIHKARAALLDRVECWAGWYAMDPDGKWHRFIYRPRKSHGLWIAQGGSFKKMALVTKCSDIRYSDTWEYCLFEIKVDELESRCAIKEPTECLERETAVDPQGGRHSRVAGRYDLIPPKMLGLVAQILAMGLESYPADAEGVENWEKVETSTHVNHAIKHLFDYLGGDRTEYHLANAICRLHFAGEQEIRKGEMPAFIGPKQEAPDNETQTKGEDSPLTAKSDTA